MDENFGFEKASEDGDFYVNSFSEFNLLIKMLPIDEVGLSFNGEVEIDEKISVIINKKIEFENPEKTIKTYQKVMEMRDLSEDEIKHINKFKLFFKKIFDVLFRGQKFRIFFSGWWMFLAAFEVSTDDYLQHYFILQQ